MLIEQRRLDVEEISTSYLVSGEGPPLLLLHALEESSFDWRWVIPELSRSYRVYAPDFPGFGDSAKPATADYSPAFFEHFATAFLDALGIEHAAVVGNSLGGHVALRFCKNHLAREGCRRGRPHVILRQEAWPRPSSAEDTSGTGRKMRKLRVERREWTRGDLNP